jgi:hypothetical protein
MFSGEARGRTTERQASELRRYSREVSPWPIVLETRDGWLRLPLIDLSPPGAKVRLTEALREGTKGRLYFLPPHWHPPAVEAIVWRIDLDGVVLRFTGPSITPPRRAGRSRAGLVAEDVGGLGARGRGRGATGDMADLVPREGRSSRGGLILTTMRRRVLVGLKQFLVRSIRRGHPSGLVLQIHLPSSIPTRA